MLLRTAALEEKSRIQRLVEKPKVRIISINIAEVKLWIVKRVALSDLYGCITNHHKFSLLKQHPFIISQFCRPEVEEGYCCVLCSVFQVQGVGWTEFSSDTPPGQ